MRCASDTPQPARALARATDPDTSHEAARNVEASGTAANQRARVLAEVQRQPGQTGAEIAKSIGAERHMPSRRLPELRTAGLVVTGDRRQCGVQGTNAMTWWPTETGVAP